MNRLAKTLALFGLLVAGRVAWLAYGYSDLAEANRNRTVFLSLMSSGIALIGLCLIRNPSDSMKFAHWALLAVQFRMLILVGWLSPSYETESDFERCRIATLSVTIPALIALTVWRITRLPRSTRSTSWETQESD